MANYIFPHFPGFPPSHLTLVALGGFFQFCSFWSEWQSNLPIIGPPRDQKTEEKENISCFCQKSQLICHLNLLDKKTRFFGGETENRLF